MTYSDEYKEPICELTDKPCNKHCEYWDNCPREKVDREVDRVLETFMDEAIKVIKKKRGKK